MKRMTVCGLAVLSIALLAAGCDEPSAIPRRPTFEWSIVEFNGHTYVKWTGYQKGGIVHDPDCKCSRDDKANTGVTGVTTDGRNVQ